MAKRVVTMVTVALLGFGCGSKEVKLGTEDAAPPSEAVQQQQEQMQQMLKQALTPPPAPTGQSAPAPGN